MSLEQATTFALEAGALHYSDKAIGSRPDAPKSPVRVPARKQQPYPGYEHATGTVLLHNIPV